MLDQDEPCYQRLNAPSTPQGFRGTNKAKVQLWFFVRDWLFRASPHFLNPWRVFLLRLFGASVATSATIRPSADIFYPWNVQIGAYSYIGDAARLYSLDRIIIGSHVSISMGATICAGTHDYRNSEFPLVIKPVVIENEAWIAAEAFLGPGVHVRRGAVIGARAVVSTGAVGEGEVWVGHPARLLKRRCSELAIK